MRKQLYLILLILFFTVIPMIRMIFQIPTRCSTMQWIPFITINEYVLTIYFKNFLLYLIPGFFHFGYCYDSCKTRVFPKNYYWHILIFFFVCFTTKIIYFFFHWGVFDMTTIIVQTFAIFMGYMLAKRITTIVKFLNKHLSTP